MKLVCYSRINWFSLVLFLIMLFLLLYSVLKIINILQGICCFFGNVEAWCVDTLSENEHSINRRTITCPKINHSIPATYRYDIMNNLVLLHCAFKLSFTPYEV